MADTLFDIKNLNWVYPETPKENVRKFCSSANQGPAVSSSNGYVRHQLVTQVEG